MRSAGFVVGIAAAALFVLLLHARAPQDVRADADARFVPRPEVARVASLGFRPLVADLYWMQAVQILGAEIVNPARHAPLLGRLIDVVTTVDPWVGHPYRFAAHWLTGSAEQVRHANRLLERGVQYHPDDWRNSFYLGFNHFYYLDEQEEAAAALERAADLPGAPTYVARLVARLRAGAGNLETAEAFLAELIPTTEEPQARAQYEAALLEIETERRARFLDEARKRYRERSGKDIEAVADLARGPHAVLRALPEDPYGEGWELDDEGRIVARRLGRRYEPFIHQNDRERRDRWREQDPSMGRQHDDA